MNIAITGSNGFIGKALRKKLISLGHKVFSIDRDVLNTPTALVWTMEKTIHPDYIFHLAAYGNHSTQKDSNEMINTNIGKTYNLLRLTKDLKYKGFINIGSSSEYGKKDTKMSEGDVPEATTFYGCTKVAATYIARAFAYEYDLPIVTVRPFSVYGPGEADFRFIPSAIHALKHKTNYPLAIDSVHDWIYIDDFVDGLITVMNNIASLKGKVVNIGTGIQYSNLEVVKMLERVSGKKLIVDVFANMRTYDTTRWESENTLIESLGWVRKHTLEEGLRKTYEYYS